jgi:hypothetical protein
MESDKLKRTQTNIYRWRTPGKQVFTKCWKRQLIIDTTTLIFYSLEEYKPHQKESIEIWYNNINYILKF